MTRATTTATFLGRIVPQITAERECAKLKRQFLASRDCRLANGDLFRNGDPAS